MYGRKQFGLIVMNDIVQLMITRVVVKRRQDVLISSSNLGKRVLNNEIGTQI